VFLDDLYHSLDPVAFTLDPLTVRWYGLGYLAGFIIAGILIYRLARRWGLDATVDDVVGVMCGVCLGIIIGGRLGYVVFYGAGYYLEHPLEILALSEGGMSFHGGLIGAAVGGCIACKSDGISIPTFADLLACSAPIGIFLVRCANFVNGELWGKECDLPWAVRFESGGGVLRHPSQLYEALLEGLIMFLILWVLSRKLPPRPQGTFVGTFLVWYAVCRFLMEFVRVPDAQLGYLWGFVTMGQLLSLPMLVVGVILLIWAHKAQRPQRMHVGDRRA